MKKNKTNWLFPQWIQQLEQWVLLHFPTIWQTQVHKVLLYTVIASILFFIGGYCWPNSFKNPLVAPLEGIIIQEEVYFLVFVLLCIPAIVYWLYQQNKRPIIDYAPLKIGIQLVVYAIGTLFILGITLSSFRMGTIYRTTHLMDKDDLQYIQNNDYFLYGFIPPDTLSGNNLKDIEEGKKEFKQIKSIEDSLLNSTYQSRYFLSYNKKCLCYQSSRLYQPSRLYQADLSYLSTLSFRSALSELSYFSDLSVRSIRSALSDLSARPFWSVRSGLSDLLFLLPQSYRSTRLTRSARSYLADLSFQLDLSDLSFRPYRSYRSYRSVLPYLSAQSYLSYRSDLISKFNYTDFVLLKLYATYDQTFRDNITTTKALKLCEQYGITDSFFVFPLKPYMTERIDTLQLKLDSLKQKDDHFTEKINLIQLQLDTLKTKLPDITFYYPLWFYQLEDGVRSIEHAQLFWSQGIITHYFKWLLYYLPFFCLLFLALPFLKANHFFLAFYVYIALFILMTFFMDDVLGDFITYREIDGEKIKEFLYLNYIGTFVVFLSLIGLAITAFFRQNKGFADFCFQMVLVPLGVFFVVGLLCDYHFFIKMEIAYTLPTWVLWAVQGMGLVAVFLMGYIRSLPRG